MSFVCHHHYIHEGKGKHWLRRSVHIGSILILWIYYRWGNSIAYHFHLTLNQLIGLVLILVLSLEFLRLSLSWKIYGQREYERKTLSAFAWGSIAMALVLWLAPGKQYAIPIIASYALGDPLLGELRATHLPKIFTVIIGITVISGIWFICYLALGTPSLWLIFLMGPVTVAAEWPCLTWIDDNALMQLIPLIIVLLVAPMLGHPAI